MAEVGYIRVSSHSQNEDRQLEGLKFDKVFEEKKSGKDRNREKLKECLEYVREGDTLHIHSLDRLGRSLQDLEGIVNELLNKGVSIQFHKENLVFNGEDDNSMSKLLFQLLGSFAEFERNISKERQKEGIAKAKARGKHMGRYPKLSQSQRKEILDKSKNGENNYQLAKKYNVSRGTIYNIQRQEI